MSPHRIQYRGRRGAAAIFILFLMVVLIGCVSLAIDLGYLNVARTETQRSADAAAMAAAWELIDEGVLSGDVSMATAMENGREQAAVYAAANRVCTRNPAIDTNSDNSPDGDVVFGTLNDFSDHSEVMTYDNPANYNVVRVRVRRTPDMNGEVPVFFAQIWGKEGYPIQAEATAGVLKNIGGLRAPESGENLDLLPFALDLDTWNALLAQETTDDWTWNANTKTITPGSDGVYECNLFPQGTGCPGNRGTVDVGNPNNSTADLKRQILEGVSSDDLDFHGGSLEFDENGQLFLNGDTGISAGMKEELASIMGKPKIIPIFNHVEGPGNNAQYTIIMFVGVRVLDVKLTGSMSSKRVIIQPANVVTKGVIPASSSEVKSNYVYSYPLLIR